MGACPFSWAFFSNWPVIWKSYHPESQSKCFSNDADIQALTVSPMQQTSNINEWRVRYTYIARWKGAYNISISRKRSATDENRQRVKDENKK